jgi:hypothetical protein
MTRIEFDKNGKPTWRNVDTAQFLHELNRMQNPCQFTQADMSWFRKPVSK